MNPTTGNDQNVVSGMRKENPLTQLSRLRGEGTRRKPPVAPQQAIRESWIILVSYVLLVGTTAAQEGEPTSATPTDARPGQATSTEADATPAFDHPALGIEAKKREKKKKAMVVLAAVAGIAISGVGAIAVTMLWARRLRRLARDPGPPQKTAGNDFWFLKPPRLVITDPEADQSHQHPLPPSASETPE